MTNYYPMNYYPTNEYLESSKAGADLLSAHKALERVAIKSILAAKKAKIKEYGSTLTTTLASKETEMADYAGKTLTESFKEGLTGKAADAAKSYLTAEDIKPSLKSPVK